MTPAMDSPAAGANNPCPVPPPTICISRSPEGAAGVWSTVRQSPSTAPLTRIVQRWCQLLPDLPDKARQPLFVPPLPQDRP